MGTVKTGETELLNLSAFQTGALEILESYDYEIADLRYIEELKQIVVTIIGVVIFITPDDISLSFEINSIPEFVANLILILSEQINPKNIHVTDSFIITTSTSGEKTAVFGEDAKMIRNQDLSKTLYKRSQYMDILTDKSIKFYNC